jgi:hypothetical protein
MGAEIQSPPGNGTYCFQTHSQIFHFVSVLYPELENIPGYGQLYIFDYVETTTKRIEKSAQRFREMLREVNPFAESYKRMHQMK